MTDLTKTVSPSHIIRLNSLPFRPSLLSFYQKLVRLSLFILYVHLSVSFSTITLELSTFPLFILSGCQQYFSHVEKSLSHDSWNEEKYKIGERRSRLTSSECHNTIDFWGQANRSVFPTLLSIPRPPEIDNTNHPTPRRTANIRQFYIFYFLRFGTHCLSVNAYSNNVEPEE